MYMYIYIYSYCIAKIEIGEKKKEKKRKNKLVFFLRLVHLSNMIVKRVTIVQRFRGGKVGEETVRQVAREQRVMGESSVVARMGRQASKRVDDLRGRLDGLVVVVKRIHNHLARSRPRAVPSQLFEFQTLPIFPPHVH